MAPERGDGRRPPPGIFGDGDGGSGVGSDDSRRRSGGTGSCGLASDRLFLSVAASCGVGGGRPATPGSCEDGGGGIGLDADVGRLCSGDSGNCSFASGWRSGVCGELQVSPVVVNRPQCDSSAVAKDDPMTLLLPEMAVGMLGAVATAMDEGMVEADHAERLTSCTDEQHLHAERFSAVKCLVAGRRSLSGLCNSEMASGLGDGRLEGNCLIHTSSASVLQPVRELQVMNMEEAKVCSAGRGDELMVDGETRPGGATDLGDGRLEGGCLSKASSGLVLQPMRALQVMNLEEARIYSAGGGAALMVDGELRTGSVAGKQDLHGNDVGEALKTTSGMAGSVRPPPIAVNTPIAINAHMDCDEKLQAGSCNVLPDGKLHIDSSLGVGQLHPSVRPLASNMWASSSADRSRVQGTPLLANPWFSKSMPWKKQSAVPLPMVDDLGQSSSPDSVAILDEEAIDETVKKLDNAIVGRMFGRRIPFSILSGELRRRWGGLGQFRLVTLSSDCFLCVFDNPEACNAILLDGP